MIYRYIACVISTLGCFFVILTLLIFHQEFELVQLEGFRRYAREHYKISGNRVCVQRCKILERKEFVTYVFCFLWLRRYVWVSPLFIEFGASRAPSKTVPKTSTRKKEETTEYYRCKSTSAVAISSTSRYSLRLLILILIVCLCRSIKPLLAR